MCQLRTQDILIIRNVYQINYIWRSFDGGHYPTIFYAPKMSDGRIVYLRKSSSQGVTI